MTKLKKSMMTSAVVLCLAPTSCALNYPYNRYAMSLEQEKLYKIQGKKDGSEDLPLSFCEPTPGNAFPCIVYPIAENEKLMRDLLQTKRENESLKRRCR